MCKKFSILIWKSTEIKPDNIKWRFTVLLSENKADSKWYRQLDKVNDKLKI